LLFCLMLISHLAYLLRNPTCSGRVRDPIAGHGRLD
jgi:hypothetical protein